jgi:hypothetical protein
VLSIAEGEPWTDDGWTRVPSKTREIKSATWGTGIKRSQYTVGNNNHEDDETNAMYTGTLSAGNVMYMLHCNTAIVQACSIANSDEGNGDLVYRMSKVICSYLN